MVLEYEASQKYDAHFDYFFHKEGENNGGNRMLTVLIYLSDVESGGETVRAAVVRHSIGETELVLGGPQWAIDRAPPQQVTFRPKNVTCAKLLPRTRVCMGCLPALSACCVGVPVGASTVDAAHMQC